MIDCGSRRAVDTAAACRRSRPGHATVGPHSWGGWGRSNAWPKHSASSRAVKSANTIRDGNGRIPSGFGGSAGSPIARPLRLVAASAAGNPVARPASFAARPDFLPMIKRQTMPVNEKVASTKYQAISCPTNQRGNSKKRRFYTSSKPTRLSDARNTHEAQTWRQQPHFLPIKQGTRHP